MNQTNSGQPFLWETLLRWIKARVIAYKAPLTASMVVGFLAYGFSFTNKLVNSDEADCLFGKGSTVTSGRWFLEMIDRIFPNFSMPWIYGVITIALISISVCLILNIFHIQNKIIQVLFAGSVLAFPSLTGIFSFMFTSSSYGLAFFLAILATWLVVRWNKWAFLAALASMVLSLALYQGFIAMASSLLVLLVMHMLMQGDDLPKVIHKGTVSLIFLILSLCIYYLSTFVVNQYLGIGLSDYATSRFTFDVRDLPARFLLAYDWFVQIFMNFKYGLIPTSLSRTCHLIVLVCCISLLLLWFIQQSRQDWGRSLLMAIMILLFPVSINCMFLFTDISAIHTLTLYSFVSVYTLAVMLADAQLTVETCCKVKAAVSSLCLNLLPLCLAVIITINVYIANIASLQLYLRYEIAYSFYTSLVADIKMMPEFNEDSKLAIIGFFGDPSYYESNFESVSQIMGVRGFIPSDYSKRRFIPYYLDFNIPLASDAESEQIAQTSEFAQMPAYPYYGSMQWFGNTLVVKLQE